MPPRQRIGAESIRLHADLSVAEIRDGLAALRAAGSGPLPAVDAGALRGLKFSAALPERLARRTLAARLVDRAGATTVLGEKTEVRGNS